MMTARMRAEKIAGEWEQHRTASWLIDAISRAIDEHARMELLLYQAGQLRARAEQLLATAEQLVQTKKPMQMNTDRDWLQAKALAEDGCQVSVGGSQLAKSAYIYRDGQKVYFHVADPPPNTAIIDGHTYQWYCTEINPKNGAQEHYYLRKNL